MTQARRTAMLIGITKLRYQTAQAALAKVAAQEAALRQTIADLSARRAAEGADEPTSPDAATVAGAQVLWQVWVGQRRAALNAELAQVLAQKADCRERVRRAFGQLQAAEGVGARKAAQARLIAARRAAYES